MRFLGQLWSNLTSYLRPISSKSKDPELPLTRFIYDEKKTKGGQSWRAFLPDKRLELSIARTDGVLSSSAIFALGRRLRRDRTLYGRADFFAKHVSQASGALRLVLDNRPRRHATIFGWPDKLDKASQKAVAIELANRSNPVPVRR